MNPGKTAQRKIKKIISGATSLAVFMSVLFSVSPLSVNAATDAALFFDQSTVSVAVGGTVTLVARVNPGTNEVGAAELDVTFNPTVLRLDSITRSSAFNITLAGPTIDNVGTGDTDGTGSIDVGLLTSPATYVTTNPTDIATYSFTVLSTAINSPVSFASTSDASAHGSYVVATRTGALVSVSDPSDLTAPTIAEVTQVPALTTDDTPSYTFSSNEAGAITYGGDCSSSTTSAVSGNNTVVFNTLAEGLILTARSS